MQQKIIEIKVEHTFRLPVSREQAKRHRRKILVDKLCGFLPVMALAVYLLSALALCRVHAVSMPETISQTEDTEIANQVQLSSIELLSVFEVMDSEQTVESLADTFEDATKLEAPLNAQEMDVLLEACENGRIPLHIALGLIEIESNFREDAVNPVSGCYGLCQLNPKYFPSGLTPEDNIRTGIGYLAEQYERYEWDMDAALTGYNSGYDTGNRVYAEMVLEAAEKWKALWT